MVAVLAIIIGWLLLKHQQAQIVSKPKPMLVAMAGTNSVVPTATNIARDSFETATKTNANPETIKDDIAQRYNQGLIDKIQAMRESLLAENLKSQDFYGKALDQDGSPLSGASVAGELVLNDGTYGGVQVQKHSAVTDGNGLFEFTGIHGAGLGVRVSKEGYEIEGKNQTYNGPVGGKTTPTDRAIYTLWSTNIHEQLVVGEKSFEIQPDGKPHVIDLTKGTIAETGSGDLRVWIQFTNQVTRGQLYGWSAGIEAINGGLLEVPHGTVMYVAPTDNYVPSFQLQQQIKGGQSGEIGDRSFYLKFNNGQTYGRMNINLYAPYGFLHPGLIRLSYAINPSGSRILR